MSLSLSPGVVRPRGFALASVALSALSGIALLAAEPAARAQTTYTMTAVASFTGSGTGKTGSTAHGPVTIDGAGNLLGTVYSGAGSGNGAIYEIAAGTSTITDIDTFTAATNGSYPASALTLDAAGDLFGTTSQGGANSAGTVFEIANTGTLVNPVYAPLSTYATFTGATGSPGNGKGPTGSLTFDANGNLFGTTGTIGGTGGNQGSVYEIAAGTNTITTVSIFPTSATGSAPVGATLDANGNLFGVTTFGGANSDGTVFMIANTGTSAAPAYANGVASLGSFTGTGVGHNGTNPAAPVTLDSFGNIFGTTKLGGTNNDGSIFEIANTGTAAAPTYGGIQALYSFTGSSASQPQGSLIFDSAGNLYGTTYSGGASNTGSAFEYTPGTGTFTTLVSFSSAKGTNAFAGLTFDGAGNLYGTASAGGASSSGTVFKLTPVTGSAAPEPSALLLCLSLGVPAALSVVRRRKQL